ncbi:MAG: peptidoglycan DD-metalloendopeptidase family protein [Patescibacteria group bacterium]
MRFPKYNHNKFLKKVALSGGLAAAAFIFAFFLSLPLSAQETGGDTVMDLNEKLKKNRDKIEDLQKKAELYRKQITTTQRKVATLANQIGILDAGISETEIDIETKGLEIDRIELELELIIAKISEEDSRVAENRIRIAELLRQVNQYERRGYLGIIVAQGSLSEIFDALHRIEILNMNVSSQLVMIKQIRKSFEDNQGLLSTKRAEALEAKKSLDETRLSLEEEKSLKDRILGETKASESEFQTILKQLRGEEAALDSTIVTIEKELRQRLKLDDKAISGKITWPINPSKGISAYFHDSGYPFRYIFEHTGIDIRSAQGTPIGAAGGGYVAKVYNGGMGNTPSYVMVLHGDNVSTVYMHLSSIQVTQDTYVAAGQIIGAVGGKPGTPGAGKWTTGPHLHFEVRKNGVPMDPLGYLP